MSKIPNHVWVFNVSVKFCVNRTILLKKKIRSLKTSKFGTMIFFTGWKITGTPWKITAHRRPQSPDQHVWSFFSSFENLNVEFCPFLAKEQAWVHVRISVFHNDSFVYIFCPHGFQELFHVLCIDAAFFSHPGMLIWRKILINMKSTWRSRFRNSRKHHRSSGFKCKNK
jgi:hypothetical protein